MPSTPCAALYYLLLLVFLAAGVPSPAVAAEPGRRAPEFPFADPAAMFDRFFGISPEAQEEALADVKVSVREEKRMGREAVQAYLAHLKRQGVRVVSRGKEVDYLRDLVKTIQPLMSRPERYRDIKIYLARSAECDARSFPGGTLVFFQGLLASAESEAALVSIVGHELSHLDRGHQLRRARSVKLAEQTFAGKRGGFNPDTFLSAGTAMMRIWTRLSGPRTRPKPIATAPGGPTGRATTPGRWPGCSSACTSGTRRTSAWSGRLSCAHTPRPATATGR